MNRRSLFELQEGEYGKVCHIAIEQKHRRRMQDIGIIEGTNVKCLYKNHYKDTAAYLIRGTVIALRAEDSQYIFIND